MYAVTGGKQGLVMCIVLATAPLDESAAATLQLATERYRSFFTLTDDSSWSPERTAGWLQQMAIGSLLGEAAR